MTTIQFLTEWALRSSILILSGALLLWALRVKDPSVRLAAWTAMLCGSLAMPALAMTLPNMTLPNLPLPGMSLPKMPLAAMRVSPRPAEAPLVVSEAAPALDRSVALREMSRRDAGVSRRFDWAIAAVMIYIAVAGVLLLRLCAGLALSLRLLRGSRATGRVTEGIEIRESDRVAAPVALGIARPAIVLPGDWRRWEGAKLDAVLAHERSHIRRNDPAVQLLSAIHRALVWHSPLGWFLHRRIVRVAEEASDDAAMAVARDRASYAEVLLEFMQRGVGVANWHGVAMARYGRPEKRIHRILNGTALSGGVTRWSVALILALGAPLAYVAAAAHPQSAAQARAAAMEPVAEMATAPVSTAPADAATPQAAASQAATAQAAATQVTARQAANAQSGTTQAAPAAPVQAATTRQSGTIRRYMIFSGDSTSGSSDSRDPVDREGLRARFGRNFAWFRQAGNEYVVTDAGVLRELQEAMEPQEEVNRMQGEVDIQQAAVGVLQADVNSRQSEVNALQQEVNRRQDLVNRIQASANKEDTEALIQKLEAAIRELRAAKGNADQETVNRRQAQVNEAQAHVNQEQGKVNEQQHKVNDEQRRVSDVYNGRIEEILDSAVRRHLAQQLM
jgi:beta-lactamase regulating signal transducer with metallopeptidase domain